MKVIIFGASGMVGQGVLRESVLDAQVQDILLIGRSGSGLSGGMVHEIVQPDLLQIETLASRLAGYDACFFCLGVSSAGMNEASYTAVTYDLTLAVAKTLSSANPQMTFVYVSGAGTDSTEKGRSMWARVKGKTENALLRLPLKAYMLRPGAIQPLHGIRSKTFLYQLTYSLTAPLLPLLKRLAPQHITTTEQVGRAMLKLAKQGAAQHVLETVAINAL